MEKSMLALTQLWNKAKTYVTIGLTVALVATSVGWGITSDRLATERRSHDATKASYQAASTVSKLKFEKFKEEKEKESIKDAKEADDTVARLRSSYDAAVLRLKAAQSSTGQSSGLPTQTGVSKSPDGPGQDSKISIDTADALICAENTARLQAGHEWALEQQNKNKSD